MKPLKTSLFIMKHGRMRLQLVKKVREMVFIRNRMEYCYRNWSIKPDFNDPEFMKWFIDKTTYGRTFLTDWEFRQEHYYDLIKIGRSARGIRDPKTNLPLIRNWQFPFGFIENPNYISDEFPNLPKTPERPETPSRKRIRPTGPPPEPKRQH